MVRERVPRRDLTATSGPWSTGGSEWVTPVRSSAEPSGAISAPSVRAFCMQALGPSLTRTLRWRVACFDPGPDRTNAFHRVDNQHSHARFETYARSAHDPIGLAIAHGRLYIAEVHGKVMVFLLRNFTRLASLRAQCNRGRNWGLYAEPNALRLFVTSSSTDAQSLVVFYAPESDPWQTSQKALTGLESTSGVLVDERSGQTERRNWQSAHGPHGALSIADWPNA